MKTKPISFWQSRRDRASKRELALSTKISRLLRGRHPAAKAEQICRLFDQQSETFKAIAEAEKRIHQMRLAESLRSIFKPYPVSKSTPTP